MAAEDATGGKPCAFDDAVAGDGFDGIAATRRGVAARGGQHGRDARAIEVDREQIDGAQGLDDGLPGWLTDFHGSIAC